MNFFEISSFDCVEHKFQGFVISDWQGIDRITDPPHSNYTYSVQAGVLAGIDMVSYFYIITSYCNQYLTIYRHLIS